MDATKRSWMGALALVIALAAAPAIAATTVTVGAVGAASAAPWALYIGMDEGFFAAQGIDIDLIYGPSVGTLIQQLTAGSLDIANSAGLVDPIYAVEHGASLAVVRIEGQVPPYALLADAKIKTIPELRGKTISIDETTGITRTYLERMLVPAGLKRGDYDLIYQGATSARFAALQSGSAQAAMLNPPASFAGIDKGYTNLGFVVDYARDLPFAGSVVARAWGNAHKDLVKGYLAAFNQSVAWFYDPKNRDKAMADLIAHTKQAPGMVATTYDFFRKIQYFEPSGKVSLKLIGNIVAALQAQGAVDKAFDAKRLVDPGISVVAPE
jgi:ABC-type nitrate/sulfonate/bicarbonate transport system substrate-binding protein